MNNKARTGLRTSFLLIALCWNAGFSAMVALPLKITVQQGDTALFTPYIRGWDGLDTSIAGTHSAPVHGTLQVVRNFFRVDTGANRFDSARLRTPDNFLGFRYVPENGFTGRDSFFFRISNSTDSTNSGLCRILVTPPEPGNMTVLIIVNALLLPQVQAEVDRLSDDLTAEGYTTKIKTFPNVTDVFAVANAKTLWDTVVSEYDAPGGFLAGSILIGRLPLYGSPGARSYDEAFWHMSAWLPDLHTAMRSDTIITGFMTSNYGRTLAMCWYNRCFANVWMSRFWALDKMGRPFTAWGTEIELIKRMLQTNHDYRTGEKRLPQTAFHFDSFRWKNQDYRKLQEVWPAVDHHPFNDSVSPFKYEFDRGGEIWDLFVNGNNGRFTTPSPIMWRYNMEEVLNCHLPMRAFLASSCHTGNVGCLVNFHLYPKNGGCVLAVGPTDYAFNGGHLSLSDTSLHPSTTRMRTRLKEGDRWGRGWVRSGMALWGTGVHGDLSLKPKMAPANSMPKITGLIAEKTGALSWKFKVTANDTDGTIALYDWYPSGYNFGLNTPVLSSPAADSFEYAYAQAGICTVRVEVADNFKARDYYEIILKTDSGIISVVSSEDRKALPARTVRVSPNPFNPQTSIRYLLDRPGMVRARIMDARGRNMRTLSDGVERAGLHTLNWDGRDPAGRAAASGTYYLIMDLNGRRMTEPLMLVR